MRPVNEFLKRIVTIPNMTEGKSLAYGYDPVQAASAKLLHKIGDVRRGETETG